MEVKKHLFQNFISRFCFLGSTFFVNILFANLLGASGSGELYYTINNFSAIALLASLSLESGNTYFLSKKEIDDTELATLSLIWSFIVGIVAMVSLIFLQQNYFSSSKYATPSHIFLFITGSLLTTYYSGLFFARRNFLFPQLFPALSNLLVLLIGYFFFIETDKKNIDLIITIYFSSFIVNGIALGILYHSKYFSSMLLRWPTTYNIKKLLRYSIFALIANVVAFLAYRIDYWILKGFSPKVISDGALGNYIQVSKLVQLFLFAPTIIATIVFPTSASGTDQDFHKGFRTMLQQAFLLNIIGCILVLIIGKWLFTFLYGEAFSLMYMCFVYSIPAILAITVVRILAAYFAGTDKIKYNLSGNIIALVVIIILNLVLIPLMGINGSALADSAGYIAYMIFLLIFFNKKKSNQVV